VVSCKKKTPLSGIFKLAHQRFFRPHGGLSALCGPGANPCYTRLGHSFYPSYHSNAVVSSTECDAGNITPIPCCTGLFVPNMAAEGDAVAVDHMPSAYAVSWIRKVSHSPQRCVSELCDALEIPSS